MHLSSVIPYSDGPKTIFPVTILPAPAPRLFGDVWKWHRFIENGVRFGTTRSEAPMVGMLKRTMDQWINGLVLLGKS